MDLAETFVQVIIVMIPPYASNGLAAVVPKALQRTTPIDMGRMFIDGRRIFGDGKTVEGFVFGSLLGFLLSLLLYKTLAPALLTSCHNCYVPDVPTTLILCVLALSGDLLGSFIKRRIGLPRGAPAPLLDQLNFIMFPLVYLYLMTSIVTAEFVAICVLLTLTLHLLANLLAYKLHIKSVPW